MKIKYDNIAWELHNWASAAVYDMAAGELGFMVARTEKDALECDRKADLLFSEPDTLLDLYNDRICDKLYSLGIRYGQEGYNKAWNSIWEALGTFDRHHREAAERAKKDVA